MSRSRGPEIRNSSQPEVPGVYRSGPPGVGPLARPRFNPSLYTQQPKIQPETQEVRKQKKLGRFQLWMYRNPVKFQVIFLTLGLSIFFSRPLYDIFIREPKVGPRPKNDPSIRI